MADQTKKRAGKISDRQRELILEFMEANPQMINVKFTPTFTKKTCDNLWEELTLKLNADGLGATKDTKKWKKSFTDWKSDTKTKAGNLKKSKTGGGERPSSDLTDLEQRLLALVGIICVEGNPNIPEAGFGIFELGDETNGLSADNNNQTSQYAKETLNTNKPRDTLDKTLILSPCATSNDPLSFRIVVDNPVNSSTLVEQANNDSITQQNKGSDQPTNQGTSSKTPTRKRKCTGATRFETASSELNQTEREKNEILRGIKEALEKTAKAQEAIAKAESDKAISLGEISKAMCDFLKSFKK